MKPLRFSLLKLLVLLVLLELTVVMVVTFLDKPPEVDPIGNASLADEATSQSSGERFAGKLVFAHEEQIFQGCGTTEVFWLEDPNDLLLDRYTALTVELPPYTGVYAELTGFLLPVKEGADGFAQYFATRLIVKEISTLEPLQRYPKCLNPVAGETIYFSESAGVWQDHLGVCHTCTPDNGFSSDGAVDNIVWRELVLTLKNDAEQSPPVDEVRGFFQSHYAERSGYYPVHVQYQYKADSYVIQIPVPEEHRNIDFFDFRGALLATYEVIQHDQQVTQ